MKKIRYGIIGFGDFAERKIMPAIQKSENSELVAIQKRSLDAAKEKARRYNIPLYFDSAEKLAASPEVDAVFIVSANSAHHAETLASARAGKHVLVEKPIAMSYQEGKEMVDACKKAGVKLMVAHMPRFSPLLHRMAEIVSSGALGEITFARAEFVYDARNTHRNWLWDKKIAGGGPLFDIAVHCLDSLRCVLNDNVAVVQSMNRLSANANEVEKTNLLSLRFNRGTIATIYSSFEAPNYQTMLEVIGTEGSISVHDFTLSDFPVTLKIKNCKKGQIDEIRKIKFHVPDLYELETTHFSDCILHNREPLVTNESSLHNQQILDLALAKSV